MSFEPRLDPVRSNLNPKARVPLRPLDKRTYEKYKDGFERELVADYTSGEVSLYLIDDNGTLVNVTASADKVIGDTIDLLLEDQTILSNIKVKTSTDDNESLSNVVNKISSDHEKLVDAQNSINRKIKEIQDTVDNNKSSINISILELSNKISTIESLVNSTDDGTLNGIQELIDYVNKHGTETRQITQDISSINKVIGDINKIDTEELKQGGTLVDFISNAWDKTAQLQYHIETELLPNYVTRDAIIVSTEAFDESKVSDNTFLYIQVE